MVDNTKINKMEKKTFKEILEMNTIALTMVIDFWKNYEPSTVLLAYAELKRRKYELNEILSYRITEFCTNNNYENIDSFLSAGLKTIGYDTYDQYFEKEINAPKKGVTEPSNDVHVGSVKNHDTENKYPALRIIRKLLIIIAYLLIVGTIYTVVAALDFSYPLKAFISFFFISKTMINSVIGVLGLFAAAESIMVIIDIERNTRTNNKR